MSVELPDEDKADGENMVGELNCAACMEPETLHRTGVKLVQARCYK